MHKKKVQILIPDSLKNPMGGMGEQAKNILACLPPHFYKIDIIGSNVDSKNKTENYNYYPISKINYGVGKIEPFSDVFLNQSLYISTSMSLEKPDLIHCFDWSTFWSGKILSKLYNIPLIVTIQLGINSSQKKINNWQKMNFDVACALEMSTMNYSNLIIHVSKNYVKNYPAIFRNKTIVIENGIKLSDWEIFNNYKFKGSNKIKMVYIGRFAKMKNIRSILKAKFPKEIDMFFIGSERGGDIQIFNKMLKACEQTENFYYLGAKYNQEKIDIMNSADAVIMPSTHEPFGIVALEALASRNILLSSFVGGMGDFLNEKTAINCGTTPESITKALQKFINLKEKEKEIRIQNGLQICKNYDWSIQSAKLNEVYNRFLNKEK